MMRFETAIQNLTSQQRSVADQALNYILKSSRKSIFYHLQQSGCRDEGMAVGIFHDAVIKFLGTVQQGIFEGKDLPSAVAFLKQAAFFIWSKHPDNPRREAMKRGQKMAATLDTVSVAGKTLHDPMDGTGNPALLGIQAEAGNVEAKSNELKLSDKIKKIIGGLSEECQERVRRMKFFHQEGEEKITHEETAADLNDPSAKVSRKKQDGCLKKFKQLVTDAWTQDFELRSLIQLKL